MNESLHMNALSWVFTYECTLWSIVLQIDSVLDAWYAQNAIVTRSCPWNKLIRNQSISRNMLGYYWRKHYSSFGKHKVSVTARMSFTQKAGGSLTIHPNEPRFRVLVCVNRQSRLSSSTITSRARMLSATNSWDAGWTGGLLVIMMWNRSGYFRLALTWNTNINQQLSQHRITVKRLAFIWPKLKRKFVISRSLLSRT